MDDFHHRARAATRLMRGVFAPTPLQRNAYLSDRYGADIFLKREDLSPVRSYKIRGALNAITKHRAETPDRDLFVAASAGNHAQGVAYVCRQLGVKGVIFMPVTTPQQKIGKTRHFGGDHVEIHLTGDYFDQTLTAAQDWCAEAGGHFLSPFDDDDVIEGQASLAVEIEAQMEGDPDLVILPVGGGGMSAGVSSYLAGRCAFAFVEPAGGACLHEALIAGHPVDLPRVDTFVDGAAVGRIGNRSFARLKGVGLDRSFVLHEDRICTTILEMLNVEGIVLEPSGAMAIELLKDLDVAGKRVVCVTSGGNFDFERLPEVRERAMRAEGVKKYFILRMPQRPGALKDFLTLLGPSDDIARFEYLKKSARNFGSVLIGIEVPEAAEFPALFARMEARGFQYQDITEDPLLSEFLV